MLPALQTKMGNLFITFATYSMVKRFFSYLLVGFLVLVSYLPLQILYGIADVFYIVLYKVVGYRRAVVRKNLHNSFPEKTEEELLRIEKGFYRHLADLFVEIIKYRTISQKELSKRCKIKNLELLKTPAYSGKSLICVQGHYGNWEWTTYIDSILDRKILSVYKPLHNEIEDGFMKRVRGRFGAMVVAKNHVLRVLARRQKSGELSAVGLLSDQVPDVNKMTHWMTFLNQDTPVYLGAEKMAKMFNLPILFIYSRKLKRGHYEIEFIPVENNPKETKDFEITEKHVRITERMIQAAPEYWIWSHKRWKHKRNNA